MVYSVYHRPIATLLLVLLVIPCCPIAAQDSSPKPILTESEAGQLAQAASAPPASKQPVSAANFWGLGDKSLLQLLVSGGMLMIPIAALSLVVVAVGFERLFALRKSRIFPGRLHRELRRAAQDSPDVSPNELFRAAELVPSSASVVLKSLLGKVGRPLPELESAIAQGVQNEAERLYHNVRWLSLAAAIAPLLGLLGTVWGMILCFYNTSQLSAGSNRAAVLAEGIYIALVTTLAGLVVAIPAAILSHYFEGKISRTLNSVESELLRLAGRLERFEGKTRFEVTSQGIFSHPIGGSVRHAGSSDGPPTPPPVRAPKVIKP